MIDVIKMKYWFVVRIKGKEFVMLEYIKNKECFDIVLCRIV